MTEYELYFRSLDIGVQIDHIAAPAACLTKQCPRDGIEQR
jgi:hypothetical protein